MTCHLLPDTRQHPPENLTPTEGRRCSQPCRSPTPKEATEAVAGAVEGSSGWGRGVHKKAEARHPPHFLSPPKMPALCTHGVPLSSHSSSMQRGWYNPAIQTGKLMLRKEIETVLSYKARKGQGRFRRWAADPWWLSAPHHAPAPKTSPEKLVWPEPLNPSSVGKSGAWGEAG